VRFSSHHVNGRVRNPGHVGRGFDSRRRRHGAFTGGVLERLLDGDRIGFAGISATSAGAMIATVFPSGMAAGNRQVYRGRDRQDGRDVFVAASTDSQLTR
jgi:predicted acylesterase/phospholipase RssA